MTVESVRADLTVSSMPAFSVESGESDWQERTGVLLEDTHFSLMLPIHNEAISMPGVLRGLAENRLPQQADIQIIFVTNNCTDASAPIVDKFLSDNGPVEDVKDESLLAIDPKVQTVKRVQAGGMQLWHIDTTMQSKANALNLGIDVAIKAGHQIGIIMDADVHPDSDAIALLFGQAYEHLVRNPDDTALLNTTLKNLSDHSHLKLPNDRFAGGRFLAFDTNWMSETGGVPLVVNEDIAVSRLAIHAGKKITPVPEAAVSGYLPQTIRDIFGQKKRTIISHMQIASLYSETMPDIREYVLQPRYMRPFPQRIRLFASTFLRHPDSMSDRLLQYLVEEIALIQARKEYRGNPNTATWSPLPSTKKAL